MSYQVLARRLRPKGFDALVGQDHVVRAIRNGLDSGRVHHAYLFTGTRGVGKTTIARILAKCLNCEQGVSSTPCGSCSICLEVEENRFIDLIEVDAASRTKVDDTRELLDNAQYRPSRGRFKVYLIDEVHMLSASSFNAFLKTLEEPPEHVKFLLATTDPKKVPVTVLSRCLQFQLKNIGRDEIARYLGEVLAAEGVEHEPEATRIIAKSAQGSMRDALSITDQAIAYGDGSLAAADVAAMIGAAGRDETGAVVEALASGEPRRILDLSNALADKGADFRSVLAELLEALHRLAVDQALGKAIDASLSPETVQLYYQIALIGYRDLFIGPDPKTGFEMTLLRMLAFAPDADTAGRLPATATSAVPGDVPSATMPPSAQSKASSLAESSREDPQPAKPAPPDSGAPPPMDDLLTVAPTPHPEQAGSALALEWCKLVGRMGLKGVDRMIAEHSVLVERGDGMWRLVLDRRQSPLLADGAVGGVEQAIVNTLGESVRLVIDVGDLEHETPAERNERLVRERQAAARRHLEEDSTVQMFLELFDGRLEHVRPVSLASAE